jgi:hypothetical protein
MLEMLDAFTYTMAQAPFGRIEQAIFNHMLYTHRFNIKLETASNIAGPVATLASNAAYKAIVLGDGKIRRAVDNSLVPVVHMYDRWPDILACCLMKYAEPANAGF